MTYDFTSLSHADFEDLSRDLIGKELGIRFEAFAAGPDGGMDGRHAQGSKKTVLQAKHYGGSRYSDLQRAMKKERTSIDRLAPDTYILTTSCKLTPARKSELAQIIGSSLKLEADIFGPGDINSLLRRHPEITKSHIKLWLTGTDVLERVVRSAAHSFNDITRDEIEEKVGVYAPNPSFDGARKILEKQHVVIISGPPGVGKTTLAEMLSYAHLAERWELIAIRGLDDGLTEIDDTRKQVFYFDDFLGRVALDKNALSKMDSDLARFIARVRKSPNARFILTTRAPIFEEARRHSEHLADPRLDISRYLLDVGIYTRRIKARILYNHLLVTGTPQLHINELVDSGKLAKIVDHKNYSPRLIALMTEGTRIGDLDPADYPAAFLNALNNPTQLWDIPFRKHIPRTCQHLLLTLFFCNDFGVSIPYLHEAYDSYHALLSAHFGAPQDPKDFEESLKILEGGFVKINGTQVSFVNPSVRDYLLTYLDDHTLLKLAAKSSLRSEWAQAVWVHSKRLANQWTQPQPPERAELARAFLHIAEAFLRLPVRIPVKGTYGTVYRSDGLSNVERLELLLDWWQATGDPKFMTLIQSLAAAPLDGWDPWRDGEELLVLIAKLRQQGYFDEVPTAAELADVLETGAVEMVCGNALNSEDLDKFSDAFEEWSHDLGPELKNAIEDAIVQEFHNVSDVVRNIDSDSTIEELIETLQKLAKRTSIPGAVVDRAVEIATDRRVEIEEQTPVSPSPSVKNIDKQPTDIFNDDALQNLFATLRLINRHAKLTPDRQEIINE